MPKKAIGLKARQMMATTAPGLYLQLTVGSGQSWVYRY